MSSFEQVKEQVNNRTCRVAHSFNDVKVLCRSATIETMIFPFAVQKPKLSDSRNEIVFMDYQEIEGLKKENEEMKSLLSDYHRCVELLMNAYRKHALHQIEDRSAEMLAEEACDKKLLDTILQQSNRISEMHGLMKKVAKIDDNAENLIKEKIAFLRKENTVLRELYEISSKFGSSENAFMNKGNGVDKMCQTEEDCNDLTLVNIDIEQMLEYDDDDSDNDNDGNTTGDSDSDSENDDVITVISLRLDDSDDQNESDNDDNVNNNEGNKILKHTYEEKEA